MKLIGAAISPALLVSRIGERLRARGLSPRSPEQSLDDVDETPVDPWLGFLEQLWHNAEPAEAPPYDPSESQVKRLVSQALRFPFQPVLDEVFGSQRRFNRSATESYAHLAAELKKLQVEVKGLRAQLASLEERGEREGGRALPEAAGPDVQPAAGRKSWASDEVELRETPPTKSVLVIRTPMEKAAEREPKKAPARKAPARKAPAKKAPAKKAPAKKAPAKKAPAKKAPARSSTSAR